MKKVLLSKLSDKCLPTVLMAPKPDLYTFVDTAEEWTACIPQVQGDMVTVVVKYFQKFQERALASAYTHRIGYDRDLLLVIHKLPRK